MNVVELGLPGVLRVEPAVHADRRGALFEAWRDDRYRAQVTAEPFVQDNVSVSAAGVIRGLHYQHPNGQGKLVTVVSGAAFDVVLDVRRGSPTFGRWIGEELSAATGRQLWVPAGFAHGFQALSDHTVLIYKVTAGYSPADEHTVRYSDPALAIRWPVARGVTSDKDATAPCLADVPASHLPM